jgi:hypothetical protein
VTVDVADLAAVRKHRRAIHIHAEKIRVVGLAETTDEGITYLSYL